MSASRQAGKKAVNERHEQQGGHRYGIVMSHGASSGLWWVQVNRWLSVRLELLGVAVVCGTALVVTIFPTNPGLAGLALTSALNLTGEPPYKSGDRLVHFRDRGPCLDKLQPWKSSPATIL